MPLSSREHLPIFSTEETVCIKQLFPSRWSRELPCPRGPEGGAHGTRQPSQTIESSAQRRRSPTNKPHRTITLMFAKATARGSKSSRCTSRILRGHCYDGGALGPLSKQGHRNGWRESTVFRRPTWPARFPSGLTSSLQTRFSPATNERSAPGYYVVVLAQIDLEPVVRASDEDFF